MLGCECGCDARRETDYMAVAVAGARSMARSTIPEAYEQMFDDDEEEDVRMWNGIKNNVTTDVSGTRAERLDYLRQVMVGIVRSEAPSVLDETLEDDGIIISRELAKELLAAGDHSAAFAAFIPRKFADNGVADWAESVRREWLQASMRFRRAAIAQERVA